MAPVGDSDHYYSYCASGYTLETPFSYRGNLLKSPFLLDPPKGGKKEGGGLFIGKSANKKATTPFSPPLGGIHDNKNRWYPF